MPDRLAVAPYKYLDFYLESDSALFFGRRTEIEILLADIISARLVVLFARTGTGKSSLIHAGIIPRLRAVDYGVTVCRVGSDPARSILQSLAEPERPLAEALTAHVNRAQCPLVIIIDQFEEFFLHELPDPVRRSFIEQVARLYDDSESGVHIVFSLREDYLAEMDAFRDLIPNIFQKESQLRLRPLTAEQAREAIEGPRGVVEPPFSYDSGVVDTIIADMPREDGFINPVELQIVCDTLWRRRNDDGVITALIYEMAGGAKGILDRRVYSDLRKLDPAKLVTLEKIIPLLSTADWTKRARSMAELQLYIREGGSEIKDLVHELTSMHLLRMESRGSETTVEWVSDHVSKISSQLRPRLRLFWIRSVPGRRPLFWTFVEAGPALTLEEERLIELLNDSELLPLLDRTDWYRLLTAAARSRDLLGLWFRAASAHKTPPLELIRIFLRDSQSGEDDVQRVMLYLGEWREGKPVELLIRQLKNPSRAAIALRALGATGNELAVDAIQRLLRDPELQTPAIDALRAIGTPRALEAIENAPTERGSWLRSLFSPLRGPVRLRGMAEGEWDRILPAILQFNSVALLGPRLPSADEQLARDLAKEYDYPFRDTGDLRSVIDYLECTFGTGWTKTVSGRVPFVEEASPLYLLLAMLPVKAYITTAMSSDLDQGLRRSGKRLAGEPVKVLHLYGSIEHASESDHELLDRSFEAMEVIRSTHLLLVLGFDAQDGTLLRFTGSPDLRYGPPMLFVQDPPPLRNDRRDVHRAEEFFVNQSKLRRKTYYHGAPIEFLQELVRRMGWKG